MKKILVVLMSLLLAVNTYSLAMKKILVVLMSLLLAVNTYSLARRIMRSESTSHVNQKDEKVKIKKEELPEATRKTLEGDAFKGWAITNAFKLKSGDYEVELKKGDSAQTIKFDKDGKAK